MYNNIYNYIPFQHENLDYKNNIINFARTQDSTQVQGNFTKVLIYTNLVDYLARNLLENLLEMVSINSFNSFGGVLYYDGSTKRTNLALGELCRELSHFEFPSKKDFLKNLEEFNKLRINVIHNLMKLDPSDTTNEFDKNIIKIGNIAEEVLNKYNIIIQGLSTAWERNKTPLTTAAPTQSNNNLPREADATR